MGQPPTGPTGNIPTGGSGWEDWVKTLAPIVGSVAGGIIDKASSDAANKANAQNVQAQIEFQRDQNASAYQRAVADMRAAGLNPALGYKQGGAQSGSGAAATRNPVMHGQRLSQMIDAYNQLSTGTAQRQLLREQSAQAAAQTYKTYTEAAVMQPNAILGQSGDYINDYGKGKHASLRAKRFLDENVERTYFADLANTYQGTGTAKAHERVLNTQATLNEQEMMNAWFRKNIAPYINSTAKAMDLVGKGVGIARLAKGLKFEIPSRDYVETGTYGKGHYTRTRKYD